MAQGKGFQIQPTERDLREKRIKETKESPPASPTNKNIMQMLIDIADRQGEILKKLNNKD